MELQTETRHNNLEAESQVIVTRLIESYFKLIVKPPLSLVECYGTKDSVHYKINGVSISTLHSLKNGRYVSDRSILLFLSKRGLKYDAKHYSETGKIWIV